MNNQKKFIISHAPFWHNGSSIKERSHGMILAALPAVLMGLYYYGVPAVGVLALSVSTAVFWEFLMNYVTKRSHTIGDGNAIVVGLLFGMLLPATIPWWAVVTGTFVAIVIGIHIFGGIGSNPFNPVALSIAVLMVSWNDLFDFNLALLDYDMDFVMAYPLSYLKRFGSTGIDPFNLMDLLMGRQAGGIGATFGLGLIVGGIYLMFRGFIRWEIAISFIAAICLTSSIYHLANPAVYTGPVFHLLTGYTLIGAFFLATEDSSSPVNFLPMIIYGAAGGFLTVLIRNTGAYIDGVIYAILVINLISPLLDKIRPKAMGKVV